MTFGALTCSHLASIGFTFYLRSPGRPQSPKTSTYHRWQSSDSFRWSPVPLRKIEEQKPPGCFEETAAVFRSLKPTKLRKPGKPNPEDPQLPCVSLRPWDEYGDGVVLGSTWSSGFRTVPSRWQSL